MQKKTWGIDIAATPEAVWKTVIGKDTYPQWVEVFSKGSCAEGDWQEGSKMKFIAPQGDGMGGMLSVIAKHVPNEYLSIQHIGFVMNGIEDTTSDTVKEWTPSFENYRITPIENGVRFTVDMDVHDMVADYFDNVYPIALQKIKELSEDGELSSLTVSESIAAPLTRVWECWTKPEHVTKWCAASPDWHAPHAENDVREGGRFLTRMEARDGSAGFDFTGVYTKVVPEQFIAYTMDDGRKAYISFTQYEEGKVTVIETFEKEHENPAAVQLEGWQSILTSFKQYVEASH
jgi:uncharacterized protein YndB with AHSA1/START domain